MANTIPVQVRAVDPFAEFNSNAVNRLTDMISRGGNCLLSNYDIDVVEDSTSPLTCVVITAGSCIKDSVLIRTSTSDLLRVDFADPDFYLESAPPFNEAGYYYVVLDYTYVKSKPAPEAHIRIIKPSQRSLFTSAYLMLKVINVIYTGSTFNIDEFLDYDPENISNKRRFSYQYASLESMKPAFNEDDKGRLVYDLEQDMMYYGGKDDWREYGTFDYVCDTSLCEVGQLVYVGADNIALPAIATSIETTATAFVITVGTAGR